MKIKSIFILILIVLNTYSAFAQFLQKEFIIGTYLDPALTSNRNRKADSLALVMAQEAGFNLLTGYRDDNYKKIDRSEEEIKYQLDLATQVGLKMIVADDRFFHLKPFNHIVSESVKKFYLGLNEKYRNTIYGYRLMDEPAATDSAWILPWVRFFNKIDPEKISYVNLLPVYGFNNPKIYDEYLKTYLSDLFPSKNQLGVVSYDFYPFLKHGVRSDYFYNLEQLRIHAKGRPIWYYPNISKHLDYIEPDESHLKFESFCPLAYGAKGIIYFTYESVPKQSPYNYADALISRQGLPTKKYYIVKKINTFLREVAGPVIFKSNYIGTYHVSNTAGFSQNPSYQLLNPNSPIISHISNNNILTGLFQDINEETKFYIFLINKNLVPINNVDIYFKGVGPSSLKKFSSDFKDNPSQSKGLEVNYLSKLDKSTANINRVEGGGMVILEGTFPANQLTASRAIVNKGLNEAGPLKAYPNPVRDKTLIRYNLTQPGPVKMILTNVLGQEVQTLVDEVKDVRGEYFVNLHTSKLAVGVYNCIMVTQDGKQTTKIIKMPD